MSIMYRDVHLYSDKDCGINGNVLLPRAVKASSISLELPITRNSIFGLNFSCDKPAVILMNYWCILSATWLKSYILISPILAYYINNAQQNVLLQESIHNIFMTHSSIISYSSNFVLTSLFYCWYLLFELVYQFGIYRINWDINLPIFDGFSFHNGVSSSSVSSFSLSRDGSLLNTAIGGAHVLI